MILQSGEKSDMQTHPAHFFYALTDEKLIVRYKDGKTETMELKSGMSGVSAPERPHVSENGGTNTMKFLLIELKEHPYVEHKTKKINLSVTISLFPQTKTTTIQLTQIEI